MTSASSVAKALHLRHKHTWEKQSFEGRDINIKPQKSVQIKPKKIPQLTKSHEAKTDATFMSQSIKESLTPTKKNPKKTNSSLVNHRSCGKTLLCVAYFLAAKPWNQSGKFPLFRMSAACVSVNHLSTSSFRPPSGVSICGSTPNFFSILTLMSGADMNSGSTVVQTLCSDGV